MTTGLHELDHWRNEIRDRVTWGDPVGGELELLVDCGAGPAHVSF
jgi:hypothetical protein